ncbi:xanthine dehydrogenase family protein molybdopterin-binding subunit [Synergistes jonesii]|uniref:Aldehyde oxidase/xanthine dehydrogenase a/b hammerhead domain-containing protein n=1 Tax=Synergistes jonesii TaxID=2754 RepID=A0A073IPH7_9BACT|nr:molybdopterin cofactor-binding domain-containing protein [Synergistes jonesii]KEJ92278.1 hypothetical protein EH55_04560 [Synergistes jonesii]OFB62729.1 hypothetical protein JS73_06745 [Synergistes jonesii]OFB63436.1 hypothetical protein JS79_07265 [Synergistes jonesii]OFB65521.1 hypothetical protein JS72_02415 [Synergistes jonesii]OFB67674.1 hypothetical protein JS78_06750 [Synergistes jonesii]
MMDINKLRDQKNAIRRLESISKVTGSTSYLDDMEMQGMSFGSIIRSPYPHAKVLSIDIEAAKKIPGVLGILCPKDVSHVKFNCCGFLPADSLIKDEEILTMHPRHEGDRIAAVVAESYEICKKAMNAIKIEYEVLPAQMTIDEAMKEGAPLVNPDVYDTNCFYHKIGERGKIDDGFEKSDYIFEGTYRTQTVHPIPMEPISCIAHWTRDEKLLIWANSQTPYQDRRILAEEFGLPECDIILHRATIGGGFGQREELHNQDVASALSHLIYRPVKIVNERNDEMISTATRHASLSKVKMGVSKDGKLIAYQHTMYTNAGAYCTHTPLVTGAPDRKCPYHMPYLRFDGIGVLTNGPVSGAFRGYGNPQVSFARESLINDLCRKMGWDSVKFRYDNVCKPGEKMHANKILSTFPADQCFENGLRIRKEIDANEGLRDDDEVKEAWGMSLISHTSAVSSLETLCASSIICNPDGTVNLMSGTVDMGQGIETALVQVVAEKFGINVKDITHAALDTTSSPYNYGSFSSGQAFHSGNAVAAACEDVISRIRTELANFYHVDEEDVNFRDKKFQIVCRGQNLGFKEAIQIIANRCRGTFIMGNAVVGLQDAPEPFSLCWAKVAYYKKEKAIKVTHVIESVDIGRVINPMIVKGQLEGAIQMGVGFSLIEDLEIDKLSKKVITADLLNYRNPLIVDMPKIHLFVADSYEPYSANGCKSVGELGVIPVAGAIGDAVSNACGWEITEIPLSRQFYVKNSRCDGFFEGGIQKC